MQTLPKEIETIAPTKKFVADYDIKKVYNSGLMPFALKIIKKLPIINIRIIRDNIMAKADLIYSYGTIILNRRKYVLELDTPLILTLYNTHTMKNRVVLFALKKLLRSDNLKSIVCISNACKICLHKIFNDEKIDKKAVVIYPYIKKHSLVSSLTSKKNEKTINLLHIGYNFYLKGSREVLEAFRVLNNKHKNLKLTMVCNVPEEIKKRYKRFKNIEFAEPKFEKDELFKKYYSKADIYVMPTHYDSFNMSILEAISCGLPVVATRMFAIPEMVIDRYNGLLMDMAVDYYKTNFMPNDRYWNIDLADYLKKQEYRELVSEIVKKLEILIADKKLRETMSKNSLELVRKKFSVDERNSKIISIFKSAKQN